MPTLLDRPTGDALHLLHVVAQGYEIAGAWPCWQWIKQELWRQGHDAEEFLQGLPTWRHGYRSIRAVSNGLLPDNGDPVALTIHGMANTTQLGAELLCSGFLAAIEVAIVMQRGITPSVTQPVELTVLAEDFIRPVNGRAKTDLDNDVGLCDRNRRSSSWPHPLAGRRPVLRMDSPRLRLPLA